MAKRKKRKYTRRKKADEKVTFQDNIKDVTNQASTNDVPTAEVRRANENSYIFTTDGCKLLVRNLNDRVLLIEKNNISLKMSALGSEHAMLENLHYQMIKEKDFRGL